MGDDPGQSVVNQWGKAHDLPNLWINDHSVFPSAMAANPALTIIALSLRLSDHFLGRN
jgi:choline dehydrogenase-like flavoprotein